MWHGLAMVGWFALYLLGGMIAIAALQQLPKPYNKEHPQTWLAFLILVIGAMILFGGR